MTWSPRQYERFKSERKQPFTELLALVQPRAGMRAADLGCGTGELTRELHETLQCEETVGVDSSESMLRDAGRFASDGVRFERGAIESFAIERDLIFSNAAFHWVADHESLLARLASLLSPDGQLAVQMPANDDHASHVIAAELAREFGAEPRPDYVLAPQHYATLLHRLGFAQQHVRLQVYGHLLPSSADVVEWVRGALLTHYEQSLGDRFDEFLREYRTRVVTALGDERPYFYTYKRVLFWARR
ncbi:MAG TPA: methyltransferase domain-containing protein [Thermoanaerobaculia bacterium]